MYCHKRATVPMSLGHKCKKSYMKLVLKRESAKMQVYDKSQSQMRPRWTFFTDSQFLPILREPVFIFGKTTYYLCLIWNGRDRQKEREEIISLRKTSQGKSFKVFLWDIVTFCLWNVFLISNENIFLPKSLPTKHIFRGHIDSC